MGEVGEKKGAAGGSTWLHIFHRTIHLLFSIYKIVPEEMFQYLYAEFSEQRIHQLVDASPTTFAISM